MPHYEAIQTILAAVQMGEGVIKVTGEVGTGKTMVCRKLIEQIESQVVLVYLPNPVLNGEQLQFA
ncbi:AAA family ATPase, partial [Escherichia coli]|nr:AAA family ATPase [Escherichia coli]